MDNYSVEVLRFAIVRQACQDYYRALRKLEKHPDNYPAQGMEYECVSFFHSRWFLRLCDADSELLIQGVQERAKAGKQLGFARNYNTKEDRGK